MGSAVSAMFLLAGMFSAEQDKTNFKKIVKNVVIYEFVSTAACSVLLWIFSGVIAKVYLGSVSQAVIQGTASALKAYTAGLLFQMIVLVFANYIQCFNHNIIPVIVYFISNVVLVLYGEAYGGTVVRFYGTNVAADIVTNDEVMAFSEKAWQFCVDKGESDRIAYLISLSVEEMAKNVIEHGFTKDEKDHMLSVRIVHKGNELIIRMRDNCKSFDPRKKYMQIYANDDVGGNIGIRMIMAEADEVSYTSMFNLNNLLIRIGK